MDSNLNKQTAAIHAVFKYDIARHVKHVKLCAGQRLELEIYCHRVWNSNKTEQSMNSFVSLCDYEIFLYPMYYNC